MPNLLSLIWRHALSIVMVVAGVFFIGWGIVSSGFVQQPDGMPLFFATPTVTPEPIFPTRTPVGELANTPNRPEPLRAFPTGTTIGEVAFVTDTVDFVLPPNAAPFVPDAERFGVAVAEDETFLPATQAGLVYGSYLNWNVDGLSGEHFWRMVRVNEEGLKEDENTWEMIAAVAEEAPGSYWLIGNEMDVKWQDNVTPERYAEIYHDVYTFIKTNDPTAQVAIGGVSQSTPLRRAYLDIVLETYQTRYGERLPTDLWNIHAFVLREEAGGWGVDIPSGMTDELAILYEIEDHKNIALFAQNIIDFRVWMAARGYQDTPLVVSEYGILMPADYGFEAEVVADFLEQTLDFFTTATSEYGYPADEYRLVQWWFWYSVYEPPDRYPGSNLYNLETGQLTPAGERFSNYPR